VPVVTVQEVRVQHERDKEIFAVQRGTIFTMAKEEEEREREHREIEEGNIDVVRDAPIYFQKVQ